MLLFSHDQLAHLLSAYGYGAVGVLVALEGLGIPLPGETALIVAAILAGTDHVFDIWFVIAAAAAGAVIGDNIGFWLGREFGYRFLVRYGHHIRVTVPRIKLGQYLFLRYGGRVVLFGRFVAILRMLGAFLAGANRLAWSRFIVFNAAGGIGWATLYGLGAYFLCREISGIAKPIGLGLGIFVLISGIALIWLVRNHEAELEQKAEAALPGPLQPK